MVKEAFSLFDEMIQTAENKLISFTRTSSVNVQRKADRSLVSGADIEIDGELTEDTRRAGFSVVSEEGDKVLDIVRSGDYLTIDPIDGTLGYLEYVNHALQQGGIDRFLQQDLGAASDFCLLLGIVQKGFPRFGAVYNYVMKEKIFIDAADRTKLVRENNRRNYSQQYAVYVDQRKGDHIEEELTALPDVSVITQAALGLKSVYTIINPHNAAVTVHRVQTAGLWDILPAAVAAQAFGGGVYDDRGDLLNLTSYIILPGTGATIVRGDKFNFVINKLKAKT